MQVRTEKLEEEIELRWQLHAVEFALDCFEAEEKRKGNPQALAGLPPSKWELPSEIQTLYDLQWELASELYSRDDGGSR